MDFFVVGTSRTGSTLLRNMLAAHPEVAILNESHWIPRMLELYGAGPTPTEALVDVVDRTEWDTGKRVADVSLELSGRSWDQVISGLRRRLGTKATVASFHDALVDEIFGAAAGTIRRGDKTPDYGFYMVPLQATWPGSRFVHIVRNGIETARSMSSHPGIQLMVSAGFDNWVPLSYDHRYRDHEARPLPFHAFLSSWRRRMNEIREQAGGLEAGSYLEIRYEALLRSPKAVLREVAAHLDLEAGGDWLDKCQGLVRPRTPAAPPTPDELQGADLEDLRLLVEVGDVPNLDLPDSPEGRTIEVALALGHDRLRQPDLAVEAIWLALGALAASRPSTDPVLFDGALSLLRRALEEAGRDTAGWAVLQEGSGRA